MLLEARISIAGDPYSVKIKAIKGKKKELFLNQAKESKASSYVGRFPVVMIAPGDTTLLTGSSEERRRLIDFGLCQIDPGYTEALMEYNKVLQNRNALLRMMAEQAPSSHDTLLETYDTMLSQLANDIYESRKSFCAHFSESVQETYAAISEARENITLQYSSHLEEGPLSDLLKKNRAKDLILQRTTRGIHLDDIELLMDEHPVKKTGSQGQQKTFVVALKMGLYTLLQHRKNLYPVLLLDDIFEKFDERRVRRLFECMGDSKMGQIFITDTHPERLQSFMEKSGKTQRLFIVNNNYVEEK